MMKRDNHDDGASDDATGQTMHTNDSVWSLETLSSSDEEVEVETVFTCRPKNVEELAPLISSPETDGEQSSSKEHPTSVNIQALKLMFGAGGIYIAFLYNGLLQEDVFRHKSLAGDGSSFHQAWLLSVMETAASIVVGFLGRQFYRCTTATDSSSNANHLASSLPQKHFLVSGAAQVTARSFKSLALANGLSFPIATLAKSGKMAPVMIGSLVLGGASYSVREYIQVVAIIVGVAIFSMGQQPSSGISGEVGCTAPGVAYILLSLALDGVTGGVQKNLLTDIAERGLKPRPYDLMYHTSIYMMLVAGVIAIWLGEFQSGYDYILINPEILPMILRFSFCSAIGHSFIFFTLANFDPLVCTTVTTTRKIFSVVLSIVFKGHSVSFQGWTGVLVATSGIVSEVQDKYQRARARSGPQLEKADKIFDLEMASFLDDSVPRRKATRQVNST
jgi:UDP-galactose transporter B1